VALIDGCPAATLNPGQREGKKFLDALETRGFIR
jgi:hypothetical protein